MERDPKRQKKDQSTKREQGTSEMSQESTPMDVPDPAATRPDDGQPRPPPSPAHNDHVGQLDKTIAKLEGEIEALRKEIKRLEDHQNALRWFNMSYWFPGGIQTRINFIEQQVLQKEKRLTLQEEKKEAQVAKRQKMDGKKRDREASSTPESTRSDSSGGSTKKRKTEEAAEKEEGTAKDRAQAFVDSILSANDEDILNVDGVKTGMTVWQGIKDVWTGKPFKVIIRSITRDFWLQCILQTQTQEAAPDGFRVCAVGTPGIGKSTSIPVLIRMLLEMDKTVVYKRRTQKEDDYKYEFVPKKHENGSLKAEVQVFPEAESDKRIDSLLDENTYYIIDPEDTKDSSNPQISIPARVIIVSSADSMHWGGTEFAKARNTYRGTFKYYPTWTFEEMKIAHPIFDNKLPVDDIIKRIRCYGCVPRDVFQDPDGAAKKQGDALAALSESDAKQIIAGNVTNVDSQNEKAPKSAIIVFKSTCPFGEKEKKVVLASDAVAERLQEMHLKVLWLTIPEAPTSSAAGDAFEVYVRNLWLTAPQKMKVKEAIGTKAKVLMNSTDIPTCTEKSCVLDIYHSVINGPENTLFHSVSEQEPLIDFIYKSNNNYYAMQVTISKSHDADPEKIKVMMEKLTKLNGLKQGEKVLLFYLVPDFQLEKFKTAPVNPVVGGVSVQIVGIPNPFRQTETHKT